MDQLSKASLQRKRKEVLANRPNRRCVIAEIEDLGLRKEDI